MTAATRPTPPRAGSLRQLFRPRAIAVVGASPKPGKISAKVIGVLRRRGFTGELYAVNPHYDEVLGMRSFASARELPEDVDVAIVVVAAAHVAGVVADCAAAGVPHAVVISSGFGEGDGGGAAHAPGLLRAAAEGGIRISGPNAQGFLNVRGAIAATFSPTVEALPDEEMLAGDVSIVAQSGGLGFAFFNDGLRRGLGFSHVVTSGNEVDLECLDYVDYLLDDPETRVIALFVEGLKNAGRLPKVAERARAAGKQLVMAKVGRSDAGRLSAISHTAHLAGNDAVYDAVLRRHGIARAGDQEELIDIAMAFSRCPAAPGDRIGVLTMSGGGGTWLSDALDAAGLQVPKLSDELEGELRALIPEYGSAVNPVDSTAQVIQTAGGLAPLLQLMISSGELDGIVLATSLAGPELMAREEETLAAILASSKIPIVIYTYSGAGPQSIEMLTRMGIAWYPSSRRAAVVMRALVERGEFRRRVRPASGAGTSSAGCGVPSPGVDDVGALLRGAGIAPGGEVLDGTPVVVQAYRDIDFGPVVHIGLGGEYGELFPDGVVGLAPMGREDAGEAISRLRGSVVLSGYGERPPADVAALSGVVATVSELIARRPAIERLELHTVVGHPRGLAITGADAVEAPRS